MVSCLRQAEYRLEVRTSSQQASRMCAKSFMLYAADQKYQQGILAYCLVERVQLNGTVTAFKLVAWRECSLMAQ